MSQKTWVFQTFVIRYLMYGGPADFENIWTLISKMYLKCILESNGSAPPYIVDEETEFLYFNRKV